jgi:hypothetical protein
LLARRTEVTSSDPHEPNHTILATSPRTSWPFGSDAIRLQLNQHKIVSDTAMKPR